jgi:hypothetical protein
MVGEFEQEEFNPAVRENTVDAIAMLYAWAGLNAATLRFHKEDPKTTHRSIPGGEIACGASRRPSNCTGFIAAREA